MGQRDLSAFLGITVQCTKSKKAFAFFVSTKFKKFGQRILKIRDKKSRTNSKRDRNDPFGVLVLQNARNSTTATNGKVVNT